MKSLAVSIESKSSLRVRLCWKLGKQDVFSHSRNFGENIAAMRNSGTLFVINSFTKKDIFNFVARIGHAKKDYPFGKSGVVGYFYILNPNITDEGPAGDTG